MVALLEARKNTWPLVFLLSLLFIAYETVLFYAIMPLSLLLVMKLVVPFAILGVFTKYKYFVKTKTFRFIFTIYALFLVNAFLVSMIMPTKAAALRIWINYSFRIFILLVLVLISSPKRPMDIYIKIPIWLGFIFSVQSIILFVLIFFNFVGKPSIFYIPYLDIYEKNYGILGFSNSLWLRENMAHSLLRLQSFFIEPSVFANFLEFVIFTSFGYYTLVKRKRYLLIFIISLIVFVLTFSKVGFIALAGTLSFYSLHRVFYGRSKEKLKVLIVLACIILVVIPFLYKLTMGQNTRVMLALLKPMFKTSQSLDVKVRWIKESIEVFKEYPLGIGLALQTESSIIKHETASAPFHWLMKTGFIGLGLLLINLTYIYFKIIRVAFRRNSLTKYIALAFVAQTIHQLSYGGYWLSFMYLYIIAILIVSKEFEEIDLLTKSKHCDI